MVCLKLKLFSELFLTKNRTGGKAIIHGTSFFEGEWIWLKFCMQTVCNKSYKMAQKLLS